jgi:hypothetical protein
VHDTFGGQQDLTFKRAHQDECQHSLSVRGELTWLAEHHELFLTMNTGEDALKVIRSSERADSLYTGFTSSIKTGHIRPSKRQWAADSAAER